MLDVSCGFLFYNVVILHILRTKYFEKLIAQSKTAEIYRIKKISAINRINCIRKEHCIES